MKLTKKKLQSLKQTIRETLKLTLLFTSIMFGGLAAPEIHSAYLLNKIGNQTVFITSPKDAELRGSATGFQVKAPSGKIYTLTNAHVCELQKDGIVMVGEKQNSGRLIPRRVIEIWDSNDLCLVEGLEGYEGLSLASGYDIGDLNFAVGYPLGQAMNLSSGYLKNVSYIEILLDDVPESKCTEKDMKIEKINTFFGPMRFCVISRHAVNTNIPIFPGNSGSPMVNSWGNVTGVIFAGNNSTAWGSAVPLEDVISFLKAY